MANVKTNGRVITSVYRRKIMEGRYQYRFKILVDNKTEIQIEYYSDSKEERFTYGDLLSINGRYSDCIHTKKDKTKHILRLIIADEIQPIIV